MMKRIISFMLCLLMLFSFAGCNKAKDNGESSNTPVVSETEFKQPENYEIKLLISINPKFTAYLDKDGGVLAVDFMNDDAKSLKSEVKSSNCNIEDLISSIISSAKKKNYFGDKPKISIDLLEFTCATAESDSVLIGANASAMENGKSFGLTVEILRNGKIFAINGELSSDNPTTSNPDTTPSEPTTPSTTTPSTPTHTHTFSKATCTAAAKCSCGATSGSALGHNWSVATCKAPKTCKTCGATSGSALGHNWSVATCKVPKTCKTCGATEGSKADHNYVDGKCSVCGDSQYADIHTMLVNGEYVGNYSVTSSGLDGKGVMCDLTTDSEGILWIVLLDRMFGATRENDYQREVTFNGNTYYSIGAGMHPRQGKIENNELVVSDGDIVLKFALLKNGYLIVTASNQGDYPVGMLLSSNKNEFLTEN